MHTVESVRLVLRYSVRVEIRCTPFDAESADLWWQQATRIETADKWIALIESIRSMYGAMTTAASIDGAGTSESHE